MYPHMAWSMDMRGRLTIAVLEKTLQNYRNVETARDIDDWVIEFGTEGTEGPRYFANCLDLVPPQPERKPLPRPGRMVLTLVLPKRA